MKFLVLVALGACGAGSPPAPSPPSNTAPEHGPADRIVRDQYVGAHVGIEIRHIGHPESRQRLPAGLERRSTVNIADGWNFTVARRGDDLAVLLIDERGVVVDDVTLIGRGGDTVIVGDCPDAFIGVAPAGACAGDDTANADVGWEREGRSLIQSGEQECSCDLLRLDE